MMRETLMLVLEATDQLQGQRSTDYHWSNTGELVYVAFQDCHKPSCGCSRGFVGLESGRPTTTARVVERSDMTIERLSVIVAESLCEGGWIETPDPAEEAVSWLSLEIVEMANRYARFGVGTVIEREGDYLQRRVSWEAVLSSALWRT